MNAITEKPPVQLFFRHAIAALILFLAASLSMAFPAFAGENDGGHESKKGGMKMGMKMDMKAAGCARKMMMDKSAEMQMGGRPIYGADGQEGQYENGRHEDEWHEDGR